MILHLYQSVTDWLHDRLNASPAEKPAAARSSAPTEPPLSDEEADRRARRLLMALPEPRAGATQRVALRLRAPKPAPANRLPGLCVALAAALFALYWEYHGELPLEESLVSEESWSVREPTQNVALSFRGTGSIEGTQDEPLVKWSTGTLHIDVTPNQGVQLAVETREAVVRVIGTSFSVDRDALGTRVEVRHGVVSVTCTTEGPVLLQIGEEALCLPRSPAGLLARARRLQEIGGTPDQVLASIELGLSSGAVGAVRDELLVARIGAMADVGLVVEAALEAEALLATTTHRRDELLRITAGLHLYSGCSSALPFLEALAREPDATDDDRAQLARCQPAP